MAPRRSARILAVALRQLTNKKIALVDGNLIFGDIGVIMNLVSTKTIADLANRIAELIASC